MRAVAVVGAAALEVLLERRAALGLDPHLDEEPVPMRLRVPVQVRVKVATPARGMEHVHVGAKGPALDWEWFHGDDDRHGYAAASGGGGAAMNRCAGDQPETTRSLLMSMVAAN